MACLPLTTRKLSQFPVLPEVAAAAAFGPVQAPAPPAVAAGSWGTPVAEEDAPPVDRRDASLASAIGASPAAAVARVGGY